MVEVAIYPYLRQYATTSAELGDRDKWEVGEGVTVGEILKSLDFPEGLEIAVVVNDVWCSDKNGALKNGDYLLLSFDLPRGQAITHKRHSQRPPTRSKVCNQTA
jgi:sulfur carrier protein ThiS